MMMAIIIMMTSKDCRCRRHLDEQPRSDDVNPSGFEKMMLAGAKTKKQVNPGSANLIRAGIRRIIELTRDAQFGHTAERG
jgi:hypothetical protein